MVGCKNCIVLQIHWWCARGRERRRKKRGKKVEKGRKAMVVCKMEQDSTLYLAEVCT